MEKMTRYGLRAGWVRVGRCVVYWRTNPKDRRDWLYFSEREGYRRFLRVGRFVVGVERQG